MYTRRTFIETAGVTMAGLAVLPFSSVKDVRAADIKAIAFDGFAIFNPQSIFKKVKELFPGEGGQLVDIWVAKQFSYQWLRTLGGKYKNFWDISKDALLDAAKQCQVLLSEEQLNDIMNEYRQINIWNDVKPALQQLKEMDVKMCFLSNMTDEMITQGSNNADINHYFKNRLSADKVRMYKPSPIAYQMGIDYLGLKKEEILFVAFAGWDMAGAKWFGYPTYWVNRLNMPSENLDASPNGIGETLSGLAAFIKDGNR